MNTPTIEDALALARRAHKGQIDKAGEEYIQHPIRVMEAVEGNDAKIVAILHDAVEDTDETTEINVTPDYLRECGYPDHIIEAIAGVTKRPDEEEGEAGYERFVKRAGQNPLSRQVKIADLQDNLNLGRIKNPTEKDARRIEKYKRALELLTCTHDS